MIAVDIATLQVYLSEARQAYHNLMTGQHVVSLRHGLNQKQIDYQRADAGRLQAYISNLEAQIANGGVSRPSGVGIIF